MPKYFLNLAKRMQSSLRDYPLTYVLILAQTLVLLLIVFVSDSGGYNDITGINLTKLYITIEFAVIFSIPAMFISKRWSSKPPMYKYLPFVVALIAAAIMGLSIHFYQSQRGVGNFELYTVWAGVFVVQMYAWLVLYRANEGKKLWKYIHDYCVQIVVNGFFAILMFAGVSGLIAAADFLFKLNVPGIIYGYTSAVIFAGFMHVLFVSQVPRYDEVEYEEQKYPRAWLLLNRFIVIPIMTGFGILLAVYFLTLILGGGLPNNQITRLILGYLIPGFIGVFLQWPARESHKAFAWFIKSFLVGSLVSMLLYFYSVYLRVSTEGLTVNRSFLIVMGILIIGACGILLLLKKHKLFASLLFIAVVMDIAIFMPFVNIFYLSEVDQLGRLVAVLESEGRIKDSAIVKDVKLTQDAYEEAADRFTYLYNTHGLDLLDNALSDDLTRDLNLNQQGFGAERAYYYYYGDENKTLEYVIGEGKADPYGIEDNDGLKEINIGITEKFGTEVKVTDVSEYDYVVEFNLDTAANRTAQLLGELGGAEFNLEMIDHKLVLNNLVDGAKIMVAEVDLTDLVTELADDSNNSLFTNKDADELMFEVEDAKGESYQFNFIGLRFSRDTNNVYTLTRAEGKLLL